MFRAAFFRVEGTLIDPPAIAAAGWLAANAHGFGQRLARLGNLSLATPLALAGELAAGKTASRLTWMGLRGMSEDRVALLSEEYYEEHLHGAVSKLGKELLERARREGRRIVFITDHIDTMMRPFADELAADDLICNRLEFRNGRATGRLEDPVVGGGISGQLARAFAADHEIDLEASWAYGARGSDALLLSAIGYPCAVNPDWQLRRLARDHHWPILDR